MEPESTGVFLLGRGRGMFQGGCCGRQVEQLHLALLIYYFLILET